MTLLRTPWLNLSIPLAVVAAIAAGVGVFMDDLYALDTPSFGVQAASQDVVTLAVAVPASLVLAWAASRGSMAARLAWHGVVFYFVYTYAIAAFMVQFNVLFLVYTTTLALALFALIGGLGTLDWSRAGDLTRDGWPRGGATVFLWVVVGAFGFLWLADIVPALVAGEQPASLAEIDTPTNGIQVLDLSLLLPTSALTAVWLRRRDRRGPAVATALLAFCVVLGLALAAMVVGLAQADLATDVAVVAVFAVITAWSGTLLVRGSRAIARATATP